MWTISCDDDARKNGMKSDVLLGDNIEYSFVHTNVYLTIDEYSIMLQRKISARSLRVESLIIFYKLILQPFVIYK